VNVAEEAVAKELLPYKEFFTSVVPGQLLHLAFVFTPAGQSCYDKFQCNSSANVTNSKVNVPNPIAKASNSITKATN